MNISDVVSWMQTTHSPEDGFSIKWQDAVLLAMAAAGMAFLVYENHERQESSTNPREIRRLQQKYERRCLMRDERNARDQGSEMVKRTKPWPKLPPLDPAPIRDFCVEEATIRKDVEDEEDKYWERLQWGTNRRKYV